MKDRRFYLHFNETATSLLLSIRKILRAEDYHFIENQNNVPGNLKILYKYFGLSQKEFATLLMLTQKKVSRYITGEVDVPIEVLIRIRQQFNIKIDNLCLLNSVQFQNLLDEKFSRYLQS